MADVINKRPFDNFKIAITDPDYFVGRAELLAKFRRSPFEVHILLGGGRLGKTSTLRAIEWNLLDAGSSSDSRAFPVYINLQMVQPKDSDHLRYVLIASFREAFLKWQRSPWQGLRKTYRRFLSEIVEAETNLGVFRFKVVNRTTRLMDQQDFEQSFKEALGSVEQSGFEGICFLLDEAEFIVSRDWGNDICSYFRALKDSNVAIEPFLGLLFSGYRGVKEYQQRVGSPLYNIASVIWLDSLTEAETMQLIEIRSKDEGVALSENDIRLIWSLAGGHPHFTQQTINALLDHRKANQTASTEKVVLRLLHAHDREFLKWWNLGDANENGFAHNERRVYQELGVQRKSTAAELSRLTGLPPLQVIDSLCVLAGTGVIRQVGEDEYEIGAKLFEMWVSERTNDNDAGGGEGFEKRLTSSKLSG